MDCDWGGLERATTVGSNGRRRGKEVRSKVCVRGEAGVDCWGKRGRRCGFRSCRPLRRHHLYGDVKKEEQGGWANFRGLSKKWWVGLEPMVACSMVCTYLTSGMFVLYSHLS